jgi:lysophospholipase L1-like esterase
MNWETILCLGDSITIGSRSYLGYPEYCGHFLSVKTKKSWNVINHATAGFTTIDLARSIDKNLAHLKTHKPEIITILIGTNDVKINTSPADFKIALEQLIIKAKLIVGNHNIVVIHIPLLMDGVMLPYKIGMNKTVEEYNGIINEVVNKEMIIPTQITMLPHHSYDGVHLNNEGSQHWGEELSKLIIAQRSI